MHVPSRLEVPQVEALWRRWVAETPPLDRSPAELLAAQRKLLLRVIAGTQPGIALWEPGEGVLLWASDDSRRALHGFGVYVAPEARGRGLGTCLVKEALRMAKTQGFAHAYVTPYTENAAGLRWLARLGFAPVQTVLRREII